MPSPVSSIEIEDANGNVRTLNVTTDPVEGSDINSLKTAIENQDAKLDLVATRLQELTDALQEQSGYSDAREVFSNRSLFSARDGFPDKFQGFEVVQSGNVKIVTEECDITKSPIETRLIPVVPGRIYPITILGFFTGGNISAIIAYQE